MPRFQRTQCRAICGPFVCSWPDTLADVSNASPYPRKPPFLRHPRTGVVVTKVPLPVTLARYGLTSLEFVELADAQGDACAVCRQVPTSGVLRIDHDHAKGWKRMPPARRKAFVRGLVCYVCNRYYLGRGITIAKSVGVTAYLRAYEARRAA